MAEKRKLGLESSATRTLLLDAAEKLMCEEGYAAVTARRLGKRADLAPQLVHYYFPSMDDLFVTLYRRRGEYGLQLAAAALQSDQPLRVIWQQSNDPHHVALSMEFIALSNHRKAVRAEQVKYGEQLRQMQIAALARYFELRGIEPRTSLDAVMVLMTGIGFVLQLESQAGWTTGHAEAEALVETALRTFEHTGSIEPPSSTKKTAQIKKSASRRKNR